MADRQYKNDAQTRGYKVMMLLAGNEFSGVAPGELAKALRTSPGNITRDLSVLQQLGLAEQLPHDTTRWRLGPKLIQIGLSFSRHLDEVRRRAGEIEQRYSREAH
ncbi:hypothetical protein EBAPG3_010400 [Nitrosospira lacus]|uniref:IclR family transcriptional regulator n=1 Tax=Nitrosospira lacus TaxID=1288494 RepID=A0A1W6SQV5_9PROT|nr:hypothetical protein [Nitrosospira lacus]ARO88152.1 hypothetical protein EBAPG3_010400 [Nitrosospira lacus]